MFKIKKTLSLLLAMLLLISVIPVSAVELTDSTASVTETQIGKVNEDNPVEVNATKGSTYTITIPKVVILSGASNTATGEYTVKVTGDLSGTEYISVVPDASFQLKHSGKVDITATIEQTKTEWYFNDVLEAHPVIGTGTITATNLSAGSWSGSFKFNISRNDAIVSVFVKDDAGNDLHATAKTIAENEQNDLLSKLKESGFVNDVDDVNLLIDVETDEFQGTATATFNLSAIASPNDSVKIFHFNNQWEQVAEKTVDENRQVTALMDSFSPIAFIVKANNTGLEHNGIIPVGGVYTSANGTVYNAGDNFPTEVLTGDIYTYGDYEYRYNMYHETYNDWDENDNLIYVESWDCFDEWWYYCEIPDGWGMAYVGIDKVKPSDPLMSINGKDITCAIKAYFLHTEIEYAPTLPDTIANMSYAFSRCENLKVAPKMPSSVTEAAYCFFDCFELVTPPTINHCSELYTTEAMFENCKKITILPTLPNSVVEASSMFSYCDSLIDASDFVIPESIVDTYAMFSYCKNLKHAPVIPAHVKNVWRTFRNCTSLEGIITINSEQIVQYSMAFEKVDMSKITLAGSCDATIKQTIANTGINGNMVTIVD